MATTTAGVSVHERPKDAVRAAAPDVARVKTPAVKWFAAAGAAGLAFEAYVLIRWVSSSYFTHVPAGPTHEPGWMRVVQDIWQPAGIVAAAFCLYWYLGRPWLRERTITTDGLLVAAFATLWFEDPLSAYYGHWFTYNANLVNMGSWVHAVPGWVSPGSPGRMLVEPILLIPFVYVYFIMVGVLFGCWVMRRTEARFPGASTAQLVAACFAAMCVFDLVAEGLIWLPLGFWEYPGGIGFLFPSTYHKFPINEMLTIAATFTGITCLRYFRDDKGRTIVERGLERLKVGAAGQTVVRFLAITFAVHAILFVGYNVPNSFVGAHSRPWPQAIQKRSYFTDYLCGALTTRVACPPRVLVPKP